jgi:ATP-binding cassette, subfamily B, multidrug efflux pump
MMGGGGGNRMSPEDNVRNMKDRVILKRLLEYATPYKWQFVLTFALMFLGIALQLVQPLLFGQAFAIFESSTFEYQTLINLLLIYAGTTVLAGFVTYNQQMIIQRAGQSIIYDIREKTFNHLEDQSIRYLNTVPTGVLVTRITNDTQTLSEMYTSVLVNMTRDIVTILGILGAIIAINYINTGNIYLALVVLSTIPVLVLFTYFFQQVNRKIYRQIRFHISRVNAYLSEHLAGMKIVQIFNQQRNKYNSFVTISDDLQKADMKQLLAFAIYRPTIYLIRIASFILLFLVGGFEVLSGVLAVSLVITYYTYLERLFEPIQGFAEQLNVLQSALVASERIFDILGKDERITSPKDAVMATNFKGAITFENVWFAYEKEDWILQDVSFSVKPGQSVAFVGATGAGKTTILKLITREYDIQKGNILVDGIDVRRYDLASLRRQFGVMLQDVFLFTGTIASNIRLRDDSIAESTMEQACEYVNATHFIDRLPNKYEEHVVERGVNYSQGQRQLLSFARTLTHQPNAIILDEATANIDTETEQIIQESLKKIMTIGTTLIVAHRLSTIQHVDQIIVMHKGKLVEKGNHQELLKQRGMYFNLYQIQFKEGPAKPLALEAA